MAADSQDLVVDASVALKWFIPEEGSEAALRVRDAHVKGKLTLYAPDLLIYEVANALRQRLDINDADLEEDVKALFLLDMTLMTPSSDSVTKGALKARKLNITVYDAVYLQLAEDIECQVLTADDELYNKTKETGLVTLLKNYLKHES